MDFPFEGWSHGGFPDQNRVRPAGTGFALMIHELAMWKMIFSLWLVPLVIALVAAWQAASGKSMLTARKARYLFPGFPQASVSPWFWLVLAVLAIAFFVLGVVQATVLLNFNVFWAVVTPLLTGTFAILILLLLFRTRFLYRIDRRRNSGSPRQQEPVAYSPDF